MLLVVYVPAQAVRCVRACAVLRACAARFVGTTLVQQLLARGEEHIKAIDIVPNTKFANDSRVQVIVADVMDGERLNQLLQGVDVVFATFALIRYWQNLPHNYKVSHDVNVTGTENVIHACLANNVKHLIQTSTSYVAVGYDQSFLGMTEEVGYTKKPFNHYSVTKILAEKATLAANNLKTKGGSTLITTSIRPTSAVFGYGDRLLSHQLMFTNMQGFMPHQKLDYVYVENVALAHLLLEAKMKSIPDQVGGEAFCITNGKPLSRTEWYSTWKALHPPIKIQMLPEFLPPILARISEFIQHISKGRVNIGDLELLTPSTLANCDLSNSFSNEKSERLLGYKPIYTTEEGIQKTINSYLHEKN